MSDDHLSIDELAELDEGLLAADRISAIRAHLHGCAECQASADAITAARAALSDLPAVTMPTSVRARIDQALAAESESAADAAPSVELSVVDDPDPRIDAGAQLDTGPIADEPAIDESLRSPDVMPAAGAVVRGRFGRPTAASAAAAAAIVLAVGAVVVAHYHHGSTSQQPSIVGGALTNPNSNQEISPIKPASIVQDYTGLHYDATNLTSRVESLLKLSPTTGSLTTPTPSAGSSGDGTGVGSSGASQGLPQNSTKRATKPLAQSFSTTATDSTTSISQLPKVLRPLARSPQQILQCAVKVADDPAAVPEYVDFGRWSDANNHNAPSAIFVFLGATPSTRTIYVTNPTCSGELPIRTIQQVTLGD